MHSINSDHMYIDLCFHIEHKYDECVDAICSLLEKTDSSNQTNGTECLFIYINCTRLELINRVHYSGIIYQLFKNNITQPYI